MPLAFNWVSGVQLVSNKNTKKKQPQSLKHTVIIVMTSNKVTRNIGYYVDKSFFVYVTVSCTCTCLLCTSISIGK